VSVLRDEMREAASYLEVAAELLTRTTVVIDTTADGHELALTGAMLRDGASVLRAVADGVLRPERIREY
jgi:hypothetical protein